MQQIASLYPPGALPRTMTMLMAIATNPVSLVIHKSNTWN